MQRLLFFAVAVAVSACGGRQMRVEASAPSLRVPMTGEASITVVVHDGPQGAVVDLVADGLPDGVTAFPQTLSSTDKIQTVTFTAAGAKPGAAKVTLTFIAQGQKKTLSLDLEVVDSEAFALGLLPSTLVVRQGQSSTSTFTVKNSAGRSASGSVAVIVEGTAPAGLTLSAGSVSLSGDAAASGTLKATANASVTVGTHSLKLIAAQGSARSELSFQVVVIDARAPDFTLEAPAMLNVRRGGQAPVEVKVNALMGFNGMVEIAAANLPAGVTADPPMVTATPSSPATLYLRAAGTALGGVAMVTLTGTSGQLVHQARVVLKVTDSGTLDGTFGNAGLANLPVLNRQSNLSRLAVLEDGKIVAAGVSGMDAVVVRLTADGAADTAFGTMGVATIALPSVEGVAPMAIVSAGAGASLVALSGYTFGSTSYTYVSAVAKVKDDGTLDSTFGTAGVWADTQSAYPYAVTVLSDGKLLVAETVVDDMTFTMTAALVKLSAGGTLESTWGTNGMVTLPDLYTVDVEEQTDGSLVALLGKTDASGQSSIDPQVTRFTAAGAIDTTFGTNGTTVLDLGTTTESAYGLAIKPTGAIAVLTVGYSDPQAASDVKVVLFQLGATGALDTAFGAAGKAEVPGVFGLAMTLNAEGAATVAGCTPSSMGSYRARALRVGNDGVVDASFSESNAVGVPVGPAGDSCAMGIAAQQPSGKLVIGGSLGARLDEGWFISRVAP